MKVTQIAKVSDGAVLVVFEFEVLMKILFSGMFSHIVR
jgi:hypothetical protein